MLPFIVPGQRRFWWPVFSIISAHTESVPVSGEAGSPIGLLLILTKAA